MYALEPLTMPAMSDSVRALKKTPTRPRDVRCQPSRNARELHSDARSTHMDTSISPSVSRWIIWPVPAGHETRVNVLPPSTAASWRRGELVARTDVSTVTDEMKVKREEQATYEKCSGT